jgi:hypothetical protein
VARDEKIEAVVKHKITADFILQVYDQFKREKNIKKKEELRKKLDILSKNLNQYLVMPKNYDKYYS